MFKNSKVILAVVLMSASQFGSAFADTLGCQHPYCNGPGAAAPAGPTNGPTIYNPQYCYEGNCYPGAYVPGAVDKDGSVEAPVDNQDTGLSAADRLKQELAQVGVERFTASDYKPGLIRHIVLFRYGSNVSAEQKKEVIHRFLALKTLAKRNGRNYIVSIDTGSEISGEGADQGLEQGFIVTFKSQGDRNYYVGQPVVTDSNHYEPAHQAFKDFVGPLLDQNGAVVFDFVAGK